MPFLDKEKYSGLFNKRQTDVFNRGRVQGRRLKELALNMKCKPGTPYFKRAVREEEISKLVKPGHVLKKDLQNALDKTSNKTEDGRRKIEFLENLTGLKRRR